MIFEKILRSKKTNKSKINIIKENHGFFFESFLTNQIESFFKFIRKEEYNLIKNFNKFRRKRKKFYYILQSKFNFEDSLPYSTLNQRDESFKNYKFVNFKFFCKEKKFFIFFFQGRKNFCLKNIKKIFNKNFFRPKIKVKKTKNYYNKLVKIKFHLKKILEGNLLNHHPFFYFDKNFY
jgi:hypothetical protein